MKNCIGISIVMTIFVPILSFATPTVCGLQTQVNRSVDKVWSAFDYDEVPNGDCDLVQTVKTDGECLDLVEASITSGSNYRCFQITKFQRKMIDKSTAFNGESNSCYACR